jgi:lysophospholipase L1-like esterase
MSENQQTLKPHSVILFQGDSITDTGRTRSVIGPNSPDGMGFGYPSLAMESILVKYHDQHLQFYNRGNSGDRIQDMEFRWELDTLRLLPDILSILIGVNDIWNYLMMGMGTSPAEFRDVYRDLLHTTREALPYTRFVLCEPFLLITGDVTSDWMGDLSQRQNVVQALSKEFDAIFVPFQSALDQAARMMPAHHLLDDGVHPTEKGHRVLAECWIKTVLG